MATVMNRRRENDTDLGKTGKISVSQSAWEGKRRRNLLCGCPIAVANAFAFTAIM